jgi:Flp pilus assembly protein TadG
MSAPGSGRPGRRGRGGKGQSLVEFAMIIPVFLLVLAGILDFGFMLFSRVTLISATREGARWAVNQSDTTQIDFNGTSTGLKQQGGSIGANIPGLTWADLTVVTLCAKPPGVGGSCDFAAGGSPNAVKGDSITVRTTYVYDSFFARLFGTTVSLGNQVQMVLEVPED